MLVVSIIIAFLIRLIALNQSLWLDEGTTAKVVQTLGYSDIVSKFSPGDFHPPLYYLFMKFWTNIFGYSEISLRMPSVLFSLLTGFIIYQIGRKLKNKQIGLWAAAFFLFNPLVVYYSQEARMYLMTTFFLTATLYFLINVKRSTCLPAGRALNVILFNLFIMLSFITFYGSVFLIAVMMIYLFLKKQYKILFISCFVFIITILLISPLLYHQLINARQSMQLVTNWKSVLGTANIKNLILIPIKFSIGRISFYPKAIYYLIAIIWTAIIGYFVFRGSLHNKLSLILFTVPVILGLLFSFYSPLLQYFRFLYLIPLMSLLISLGTNNQTQRIGMLTGFVILSLIYLLNPQFHREDWKNLSKSFNKDNKIFMVKSSADGLIYYNHNLTINELSKLTDYLNKEKNIIIIPYTSEIHGIDYKNILKKNNYFLSKEIAFRQLMIEYWSKK